MNYYPDDLEKYVKLYSVNHNSYYSPLQSAIYPIGKYSDYSWLSNDNIFKDKSNILVSRIEEVYSEITGRQKLKESIFYKICYQDLQFSTKLLQLDSWNRAPGQNMVLDRRRSHLERTLLDLEKFKLQEEESCWRDVANLKKELRDVLAEYRDLKRKEKWLE